LFNIFFKEFIMSQAMFIFWTDALHLVEDCRKILSSTCDIQADIKIEWTESLVVENLKRLYQYPLIEGKNKNFGRDKMTGNSLHVFYVNTTLGKNVFHRSAAGEIEYVNSHLMELKSTFRSLTENATGKKYLVHCAAESSELQLQTALMFGAKDMALLHSGGRLKERTLTRNLIGSDGWNSLAEAFEFLSCFVNWCVLRGWNTLPDEVEGDDLDVLVDNRNFIFSGLGLYQIDNIDFLRNGYMKLKSDLNPVKFDVHWVGDGYFDTRWQQNVLDKKNYRSSFYFPDEVNALMTALYAEYVARPLPRSEKFDRLSSLIKIVDENKAIGVDILLNPDRVILLLNDFMNQNRYEVAIPKVRRHNFSKKALHLIKPRKTKHYKGKPFIIRAMIGLIKIALPSGIQTKLRALRQIKNK